ncbi:NAD(P)H-dependent oxidoreductase subunit E [Lutibaculum baratangense]|uniref:Tungsten-containing formate dehydrogenase beta subunit n=1 Tax=Lutibaculum baratangense AMV1 TaxID=631454 RepID=V4RUF5_9HYPH|nr:NAD(P)H-dependent oxidoreductase subunit E [Lutibaculum baratangense]ESR26710.1 tungsten-containing formate dehydrogenase beta subunit [Lutibaculum baratangense AMV1]
MTELTTDATKADKKRAHHPGSGRRKAPVFNKGRVLAQEEKDRLLEILGPGERQRDMLIEYLHKIQDAEHCLPAGLLHALAEDMRIPMAEVYEVATFYAHFDVVRDGEERPEPLTIRVCESLSCALAGAERLYDELGAANLKNVRIVKAPCMGRCDLAPTCEVGHNHIDHATAETVAEAVEHGHTHPVVPLYRDFDQYVAEGGYQVLARCLSGDLTVESVMETLLDGGLRGLGGAGFPTGRKWGFVRAASKPRLMAVNGDEGEPGTFKDRYFLETNPHAFLEGMLIGAWAVEAEAVYIYLRDEYPVAREILLAEIAKLNKTEFAKHTKIWLRRGAGAYICGEESAMIESIEGNRGYPRHRPPYVAQVGIFNRPTLVNNVETLYWIPKILEKGAQWFADHGKNGAKGLRSYSVSGRVKNPGVKTVAAGTTVRELIEEHCGGMLDGHEFKGYLPGGASGGILPASMGDLPLEFGVLEPHGAFVGSHAVVILSNHDDMTDVAFNLMHFFETESCGQCTPCRNGTEKARRLMAQNRWDLPAMEDLSKVMRDASICGLGQAAPNPLISVLKFFEEDVKARGERPEDFLADRTLGDAPAPGGEERAKV